MKITSAHRSAAVFTLALTLIAGGSSAFARTAATKAPTPAATTVAIATTHVAPAKTIGTAQTTMPSGPTYTGAITPQQLTDAYNRWAQQTLRFDPAIVHTP